MKIIDNQEERLAIQNEPGLARPSFAFIHNAEIIAGLRPIEWRIRDILPEDSFFYDFGESGHYKTFAALDRALAIAAGIPYHGHATKQGTVFYICGEGAQGIGRRIAAWHIIRKTKAAGVPFFLAKVATQLVDPKALDEVRRAVDFMAGEYGPPALVHIDTLARNFGGGDENSTSDMNLVVQNLDAAFRGIGRGLSHHTGHSNKDRARGAYALHAAADAAFRIRLTGGGQVLVENPKQKDSAAALPILFNRREVLLRIGDTDDRSYVLELAAEGEEALELAKSDHPVTVAGKAGEALEILRELYAACRCNLDASGRPKAMPHVTVKAWQKACFDRGLFGARAYNFKRAAANMLEKGLIQYDRAGVHVYPAELFEQD